MNLDDIIDAHKVKPPGGSPRQRFKRGDRITLAGRPGKIESAHAPQFSEYMNYWVGAHYSIEFDDLPGHPLGGYFDSCPGLEPEVLTQ